jgi:tetratricopeptide (TPR) repeat protein
VVRYSRALEAEPKLLTALNNLAWLLATDPDAQIRNGSRAVELADRACQLTEWKAAFLVGTLAAGYAEAGRFEDARNTAQKAIGIAEAAGEKELADRNRQLLKLYQSGKPFHETPP